MGFHDWLLKLEAKQGGNILVCVPTEREEGRQKPAVNYVGQQVDNHSNTAGPSPDLDRTPGSLQEKSRGLL